MAKKNEQTAAEFLAELEQDPEYQRRSREHGQKMAEFNAMLDEDEKPLIAALRHVGAKVQSVWELVNTDSPYPSAIPVLVEHLKRDYDERTKEGIARLCVPDAAGIAVETLVDEFVKVTDPESQLKWVLGLAIATTTTSDTVSMVVDLVRDPRHGHGRAELPRAMVHLPYPRGLHMLEELTHDPVTRKTAGSLLKKITRRR